MNTAELEAGIVEALEDLKAVKLVVLNVGSVTDMTDTMIFASGASSRHVKSLADNVVVELKKKDMPPMGVEGQQVGEWVLVDYGDVVVHIMLPETRDFYDLERLWSNVPSSALADD